jgi:peptidoglycan/LPS O-acetylase OafA/YrhL
MRGIAALVVVFDHMRSAFFLPYRVRGTGQPIGSGLLVRLIYMDHYYAQVAVIVFFALSGYLVGSSVIKSTKNGTWSWSNYLLTRLTRLYVVLIPALLLTWGFDFIGRSLTVTSPTYLASESAGVLPLAAQDTVSSFFGTMFFVQNVYTNVYGTLGPAWSLANEFCYYLLFPFCVLCLLRRRHLLLNLALLVAVAVFWGGGIVILFPTWLGGIVAGAFAKRYPLSSRLSRRVTFLISIAAAAGTVLASAAHRLDFTTGSYILGLAAIGLIWVALCSPPANDSYDKVALFFSEISYTLYLTHEPFLILLSALWIRERRWPPDFAHLLLAVVPISAAVIFAYLIYLLFESRTDTFRRFLKQKLLTRSAARAATVSAS